MASSSMRRKLAPSCDATSFAYILLLFFCRLQCCSTAGGSPQPPRSGFVLPLLHRTSLPPPYTRRYTSPLSKLDFFAEAKSLDQARILSIAASLSRSSKDVLVSSSSTSFNALYASNASNGYSSRVRSGASAGAGQYFVQFAIGSPPQKFMLIADTGSDLVWVRCSICKRRCRDGGAVRAGPPLPPTFLARASSTYRPVPCLSQSCLLVPAPPSFSCNLRIPSTCRYDYTYADASESSGVFSMETISLNPASTSYPPASQNITAINSEEVKDFAFGCGLRNAGQSFVGSDGVLGMGRGMISFVQQVGSIVGNKFSYCLVDFFSTPSLNSLLIVGDPPMPIKLLSTVQSTPLIQNSFAPSFYYVNVLEVAVNGKILPVPSSVWELDAVGNGGTVLDTGTTLTTFVEPAYQMILNAISEEFPYPKVDPVQTFDLCFNATGLISLSSLPTLSITFEQGAVFSPPASNIFIDIPGGLKCLSLQGVQGPFAFTVLGNLIQQNFHMEFDLDSSMLRFASTQCSGSFR